VRGNLACGNAAGVAWIQLKPQRGGAFAPVVVNLYVASLVLKFWLFASCGDAAGLITNAPLVLKQKKARFK